jgi:hypothetical protein
MAEALPEITDEAIEKAALPKDRRTEENVSEESTFVELEGKDLDGLPPIKEEKVQEKFEPTDSAKKKVKDIDDEADKYANLAQNRIAQAVRQAKDFQRRELQALQYAKELTEENNRLKNDQVQINEQYSNEFDARVNSQITSAKSALKEALDSQDSNAIAEAQSVLAAASADKVSLVNYQKQLKQWQEQQQMAQQQQQFADEQQRYQQQQTPNAQYGDLPGYVDNVFQYNQPSTKAKQWANDNTWFGQDQVMTNVAIGIHGQLEKEGFDTESDDYYSEINKRLRHELPNRFDKNVEAGGKPVQTVASPSRGNSNGRRKNRNQVELTPSEQQLAKRLGVSFKDYAIHKARLDSS